MKVSRLYRILNIQKAKVYRKDELDLRAKLETATTNLHNDVYNEGKHGKVWKINNALEEVRTKKLGEQPLGLG